MDDLSMLVGIPILLDEVKLDQAGVQFLSHIRLFDAESGTGRNVSGSFLIHRGVFAAHTSCL